VVQFTKAIKHEEKLRLALIGPAGSGKTYTALSIAQCLGERVALMDTEHGSAAKYADLFNFDTIAPDNFAVEVYIDAIKAAEAAGYGVLILDSLSHAWAGKGGLLEFVDTETAKSRSHNAFSEGWRKATPKHNELIDTMLACDLHLIVTMRTKTEYVVEKDEKGRSTPRKVGLQPIQRDGLEYEFDVVADLDQDNNMVIGKTRCPVLTGKMFNKAGQQVADILKGWLSGAPKEAKKAPDKPVERTPGMFFTEALQAIPYYNHVEHVKATLKLLGFTGYAPAKEAEMLAALQQHANEKANEAAQHTPAIELQGEVA